MSLTTILESQRDSSLLFMQNASAMVDYLKPTQLLSTDRSIVNDLKVEAPQDGPALGRTVTWQLNVSDTLENLYVAMHFDGADNRTYVPLLGLKAIKSYRIMLGNETIHNVEDYASYMAATMGMMDTDRVEQLLTAAGRTATVALQATTVYAPLPTFLDKMRIASNEKDNIFDLRDVNGRIRVQVTFRPEDELKAGTSVIPVVPKMDLYYSSVVFSEKQNEVELQAASDEIKDLFYKGIDVSTSLTDIAIPNGETKSIDISAYTGSQRLIAVVLRSANDVANRFQPKYLNSTISVRAAGRDYYKLEGVAGSTPNAALESTQSAINSLLNGYSSAPNLVSTDFTNKVFYIPIGIDSNMSRYAGGLNVSRISKTEIAIKNNTAAPLYATVVMYTDALYQLNNRTIQRWIQA